MFIKTDDKSGVINPVSGLVPLYGNASLMKLEFLTSACGLIGLFILTACKVPNDIQYLFSVVFSGFFIWGYFVSSNKNRYLKHGVINLLLILPFYPALWLTVGVTIRMIKSILEFTLLRINSAFHSMLIIGCSLVVFASISILQFETVEASNIKDIWDAMWWSICTITTVGYGDKFPVTSQGRTVATILMISGIGLFGTLIGYISTFFTDKEKKNNNTIDTIEELSHQINQLREELKQNNGKNII